MKVTKYEGMLTRKILIASITSTAFLKRFRTIYTDELVQGRLAKKILSWCITHFENHGSAPNYHIQEIFAAEETKGKLDPDTADDIADFLSKLSKEAEASDDLNIEFLLQQAEQKLQQESLRQLTEDIEAHLDNGDVDKAQYLLADYRKVTLPSSDMVNPLTDEDAIREAFEWRAEPLLRMPGALGQAINDQFTRDSFVAFMGREKIGKTWMLIEIAFRALQNRKSVAFFQAGDLSRMQQITRFAISLTGKSNRERYCGEILIPIADCWHNQTDSCTLNKRTCGFGIVEDLEGEFPILTPFDEAVDYVPCTKCLGKSDAFKGTSWFKKRKPIIPLTHKEVIKYGKRMEKGKMANIQLSCHSTRSVSVRDIDSILNQKFLETGFIPDVIIIDYADILAPESGRKQERHQENERWEALRKLSQDRKACVVTATQADADSYTRKTLSMKNFSEDKRKLSHVTAMFGLNQIPYEKKYGRFRINQILAREDEFDVTSCITVLQALQIGRPFLFSYV